jgi:hypothetical protein
MDEKGDGGALQGDLERGSFNDRNSRLVPEGKDFWGGKYCMNETSYGQSCIV